MPEKRPPNLKEIFNNTIFWNQMRQPNWIETDVGHLDKLIPLYNDFRRTYKKEIFGINLAEVIAYNVQSWKEFQREIHVPPPNQTDADESGRFITQVSQFVNDHPTNKLGVSHLWVPDVLTVVLSQYLENPDKESPKHSQTLSARVTYVAKTTLDLIQGGINPEPAYALVKQLIASTATDKHKNTLIKNLRTRLPVVLTDKDRLDKVLHTQPHFSLPDEYQALAALDPELAAAYYHACASRGLTSNSLNDLAQSLSQDIPPTTESQRPTQPTKSFTTQLGNCVEITYTVLTQQKNCLVRVHSPYGSTHIYIDLSSPDGPCWQYLVVDPSNITTQTHDYFVGLLQQAAKQAEIQAAARKAARTQHLTGLPADNAESSPGPVTSAMEQPEAQPFEPDRTQVNKRELPQEGNCTIITHPEIHYAVAIPEKLTQGKKTFPLTHEDVVSGARLSLNEQANNPSLNKFIKLTHTKGYHSRIKFSTHGITYRVFFNPHPHYPQVLIAKKIETRTKAQKTYHNKH